MLNHDQKHAALLNGLTTISAIAEHPDISESEKVSRIAAIASRVLKETQSQVSREITRLPHINVGQQFDSVFCLKQAD